MAKMAWQEVREHNVSKRYKMPKPRLPITNLYPKFRSMAHHHHPLLLLSSSRPSLLVLLSNSRPSQLLKPLLSPLLLTPISRHMPIKMYSKSNKDKDEHEIGEKGRSTAEEFVRVAKEKEESVRQTQSSDKTFEVDTEPLVDDNIDTELAKEKYKKKGQSNFDHIGQD